VPEQRIVESKEGARIQGAELGFPLIVKPQRSFSADDTSARQEVAKVSDAGELAEAVARLLPYDAVAVDLLYERMEAVFGLARGQGLVPKTLQEIGDLMLSGAPPFASSRSAPTTTE
jgi:hypothetical protein